MEKPLTETTRVSLDTPASSTSNPKSVDTLRSLIIATSGLDAILSTAAARILMGDTFTEGQDSLVLDRILWGLDGIENICGEMQGYSLDIVTQLLKVDGRYFTMTIYLDKTDLWPFCPSQRMPELTCVEALAFMEHVMNLNNKTIYQKPSQKQIEEAKWAVSTL